jgi:hypothetical protein
MAELVFAARPAAARMIESGMLPGQFTQGFHLSNPYLHKMRNCKLSNAIMKNLFALWLDGQKPLW